MLMELMEYLFQEFMGEESTIERLFKSMDTNGDGFVTKEVKINMEYYRNRFFLLFWRFDIFLSRSLVLESAFSTSKPTEF